MKMKPLRDIFCIDAVVKSRFDIFIVYIGIGNINYSIRFLIVVSLKFDYIKI
jgi:hypothetical protein